MPWKRVNTPRDTTTPENYSMFFIILYFSLATAIMICLPDHLSASCFCDMVVTVHREFSTYYTPKRNREIVSTNLASIDSITSVDSALGECIDWNSTLMNTSPINRVYIEIDGVRKAGWRLSFWSVSHEYLYNIKSKHTMHVSICCWSKMCSYRW